MASPSRSWSRLKSGRPASSRATTSPSTIASRRLDPGRRRQQPREVGRGVLEVARPDPDLAVVDDRLDAEAVPLDLEQPVGVAERLARRASPASARCSAASAPSTAPARSISAAAAGASPFQSASRSALTSSLVRPVLTLCGWSSASQPATAASSRLWISSHWSPASSSNARADGSSPCLRRPLVRTIVKRPLSFSPLRHELELAVLDRPPRRRGSAPRAPRCPSPRR